jgi:D-arabinose 1-dehydrogenase-like Zn-dependent alcohol dehydrogenase
VSLADPVGQEVLVEVKASGLCHSDLHAGPARPGSADAGGARA